MAIPNTSTCLSVSVSSQIRVLWTSAEAERHQAASAGKVLYIGWTTALLR